MRAMYLYEISFFSVPTAFKDIYSNEEASAAFENRNILRRVKNF